MNWYLVINTSTVVVADSGSCHCTKPQRSYFKTLLHIHENNQWEEENKAKQTKTNMIITKIIELCNCFQIPDNSCLEHQFSHLLDTLLHTWKIKMSFPLQNRKSSQSDVKDRLQRAYLPVAESIFNFHWRTSTASGHVPGMVVRLSVVWRAEKATH